MTEDRKETLRKIGKRKREGSERGGGGGVWGQGERDREKERRQ